MDQARYAKEVFQPFYAPNILPETAQELSDQGASDPAAQLPHREPGDVQDGSVEYFDYDWGQPVRVSEDAMFSGCRQGDTSYTCCEDMPPCEGWGPVTPDPPVDPDDPCIPEEDPPQGDDPGYEVVTP